jgi:type IV secretory pathway VirB2 component (pilin)
MKKILEDLLNSFKGNKEGFSSRKLTAFVLVIVVIIIHGKWLMIGNLSQLEMVLTIDYTFIAALFGMTTFSSIKNASLKKEENEEVIKKEDEEELN